MRQGEPLARGRDQPFYHVLIDVCDMEPFAGPHMESPGKLVTYVAEENLIRPAAETIKPISHPLVYTHLDPESFQDGAYQPVAALRSQHPRGVEGCWLVDAVTPDGRVARGQDVSQEI